MWRWSAGVVRTLISHSGATSNTEISCATCCATHFAHVNTQRSPAALVDFGTAHVRPPSYRFVAVAESLTEDATLRRALTQLTPCHRAQIEVVRHRLPQSLNAGQAPMPQVCSSGSDPESPLCSRRCGSFAYPKMQSGLTRQTSARHYFRPRHLHRHVG